MVYVLLIFCLIPTILGIAELLHIFKSIFLKPKKDIIFYNIVFLTNENPAEQLLFAINKSLWQNSYKFCNLIAVNSISNPKFIEECKTISKKYDIEFLTLNELTERFKSISC